MEKQLNEDDIKLSADMDTDADLVKKSDNVEMDSDTATDTSAQLDDLEMLQQEDLAQVNQTLSSLQDLFEKQIARNQNQTEMFDKIYAEMKEYKESFLLEVLHKPIIHNLIQLYDSYGMLETQLDDILNGSEETLPDELNQFRKNLENFRFKLEEVLYRMDVTPYKDSLDTLDRHLHKTRKVIPSEDPQQDQKIAEVHKIGFHWREKVFRPEEVTIFRYIPDTQKSENPINVSPSNEKGGGIDG